LIDATERLLSIMEDHGLVDNFLLKLRQELKREKEASMDNVRQKEMVSRMVIEYTEELERHLAQE